MHQPDFTLSPIEKTEKGVGGTPLTDKIRSVVLDSPPKILSRLYYATHILAGLIKHAAIFVPTKSVF